MLARLNPSLFDDESRYVDRFGLLIIVTIGAIVVQSLFNVRGPGGTAETEVGALLITVFVGSTFLLGLRASGVTKKWQRVADAIVIVGFAVALSTVIVEAASDVDMSEFNRSGPLLVRAVLAVVTPIALVARLTRHRRVTSETLIGAVSAYLLIALAFHYLFLTVDGLQSTPFFGEPEPTTRFMYFSLVTMTTLGYGDLAPSTNLGGLTANAEAVIGQVFLVTFVAMLVGLLIGDRRDRDRTR